MPYNVVSGDERCPASKPFAVVGGRSGDALFGCHDTKESARNQQKALYAQDDDEAHAQHVHVDVGCPRTDTPVCYTTPATVAW